MSGPPDGPGHAPGITVPTSPERQGDASGHAVPPAAGPAADRPRGHADAPDGTEGPDGEDAGPALRAGRDTPPLRTGLARPRGPRTERAVLAELREGHAAFNAAQLPMALVGRDGLVVAANRALGALLGTDPARLVREAAADLVDLGHDARTWAAYRDVLGGRGDRLRCTRRLERPDGQALWTEVTVAPVREGSGVLLSVADVTERRDLQKRLWHLQRHDPVTRLPNRTLFFERLTSVLEAASAGRGSAAREAGTPRRGTGRIGLCSLDLDGFKAVNDTLGYRMGDRLLVAVAERLTGCVERVALGGRRGGHLVARLGGDEFAVLVEESTGTEQLSELAQALLAALQKPFELAGQRLSLSASIGVVERPAAGNTVTGLMQAADTTLYWAKADGRARWALFDTERNAHRTTRQTLSSTLRPAVERGEFLLEYQPLVALEGGELQGVEALVRWRHPQFGVLAPNRFIGLAEENGAIVQLGRWVLENACRQARRWQLECPGAPVVASVNVAVRQVWDSDLVADVAGILERTGLPPELLQLELTESALMGSAGRPLQALRALSDMGVAIAIDDFGTGYSNLAYLSRLPVSTLKLDGSFVQGFRDEEHPNPADEVIVEALVELAHRLGLTVIAEGVESAEQAERLRRIGCDTAQGWLYSRPVPPDRISALLCER